MRQEQKLAGCLRVDAQLLLCIILLHLSSYWREGVGTGNVSAGV